MPDAICIGHWAGPNKQETRLFTGIADVHLTPDLHSPSNYACAGTRQQYHGTADPNIIVPGDCIGVHFYDAQKGKNDIK
ncbi:hypothetical protein L7E55_15440 [Pelotomaculum isophthalicicum JI]|uniref:Uncharacterized protein n=1 Tax=Pelotomaculum isophthalicicum JI TaxID=947010 RepID=A0A9X4H0C5_9FIRM|nr:hypothetical protein [Pelotomaculum isophthalicicum]MDF9409725.1 hypothetical protein [Pelotomaculum isophthalicicum JI]